jgi:hypothetical protein
MRKGLFLDQITLGEGQGKRSMWRVRRKVRKKETDLPLVATPPKFVL